MAEVPDQLTRIKGRKEAALREGGDGDVENVVDFYRGSLAAASVIIFDGDPVKMLRIAEIGGAMLTDVDEIWVATDTFGSRESLSPVTGKRWAPNEMGEVFATGRFPGVVHEQLVTMCARRGRPVEQWSLVYERGTSAFGTPTVTWREPDHFVDGREGRLAGRVPDTLRQAVNATLIDAIDAASYGLTDPEEIEGHRDSAAGKMMMAAVNCAVLLMPRSKTASHIVDVSFNDRTLADFRAGVMQAGKSLGVEPRVQEKLREVLYGSGERREWDVLGFLGKPNG